MRLIEGDALVITFPADVFVAGHIYQVVATVERDGGKLFDQKVIVKVISEDEARYPSE